jgi:hypothetical protein
MEEGKDIKESRKRKEEIKCQKKDGRGERRNNLNYYKSNHQCTYNNFIQHKHKT